MAIMVKDPELEAFVTDEMNRRGYATKARTLGILVRERKTQLEIERARQEIERRVEPAAVTTSPAA
jgi:hypothetical protein